MYPTQIYDSSQTRASHQVTTSPPSPSLSSQISINNLGDHPSIPVSPLLEGTGQDDPPPTHHVSIQETSPEPLSLTTSPELYEKQRKKRRWIDTNNNGWWWEIASMVLSTICMVLLLVLLLKTKNRSLESWKLPIQLNSLIAVFTTIAKTSMMVPVASCLGQLKWRHFMRRSDRLYSLQLFDDAGRGPWGSTLLLFNLRKRAILAWAFAFVTIVALGIDPSAQQILDFPARTSPLTNVTAILGFAGNYVSKGYLEGDFTNSQVPNPNLLKLQAAILNGASGDVFQPTLDCPEPATSCQWDRVTTLGICSTFENVTDVATRNCTGSMAVQLNCTYDFPGRDSFNDPIEMAYNNRETSNAPPSDLFRSISSPGSNETTGNYLTLVAVKVMGDSSDGDKAPATEVYQATWFWCARTFKNVTASARGLNPNAGTFERLSFSELIAAGTDSGDLNPDYRYDSYVANSTGAKYNITSKTSLDLWSYLSNFLSQQVEFSVLNRKEDGELDIGSFLYTSDLHNVTDNIATTLTNQIRSRSPGDNSEAVTAKGTATFKEAYIHVRWGWLVLPMGETFLVWGLLLAVIVVSRKQPLLKESVIAYIAHSGELNVRNALEASQPVTGEEMSDAAKKVTVRLAKLDDEQLRFVLDHGPDR